MSAAKSKPAQQDQAQQPLVAAAVVQPTTQKEPSKVATKSNTPELDLSKMSVEDMLALSARLTEAAKEQSQKLFDETITFLADKLKHMGRTKEEAMGALYELMSMEEQASFRTRFRQFFGVPAGAVAAGGAAAPTKQRAARGSKPAREHVDKDSSGARPEPGKTYLLNGQTWTKAESGKGATKKEFVDAIKGGAKWSELLKK